MHELSIARSLSRLVTEHTPPGAVARRVYVRVGPLQAIEPEAMKLAWRAQTLSSPLDGAALDLQLLPFPMRCDLCSRTWETHDPSEACTCGNNYPDLIGGSDEVTLVSVEVDAPPHGADTTLATEETVSQRGSR